MQLVGLLSDTHGTLSAQAYAELADCDLIVHLGDICATSILTELRCLAPVVAVLGNNDYLEYGKDVDYFAEFEVEGVSFLAAHKPGDLIDKLEELESAGKELPPFGLHGHTHIPRKLDQRVGGQKVTILCPGSVSYPRGGSAKSLLKLQCHQGELVSYQFVGLS